MFNNVGGFVFHIANIIILLYCIFFYRESTATPVSGVAHIFWLSVNIKGLSFSASAAIMINHTVCLHIIHNSRYAIYQKSPSLSFILPIGSKATCNVVYN